MRNQFIYLILIALFAIGSNGRLMADAYKKYHINQNFDELEVWPPEGWAVRTGNTASVYGRNGSVAIADGKIKVSADKAPGARGAEIAFPAPQANETMANYSTFLIEFDWTVNNALTTGTLNSLGVTVLGSHSDITHDIDGGTDKKKSVAYYDVIFGVYVIDDGYIYYWNKDIEGPSESQKDLYLAAYNDSWVNFNRKGADIDETKTNNAAAKTNVTYTLGNTYHIAAELDFATKKVVSLTITDKDAGADAPNTETITNLPFVSDQVTDLAIIDVLHTRTTGDVYLDTYLDNLEVYVNEESLGHAAVTINYLDQNGDEVREPRVIADQEISTLFTVAVSDKTSFTDDTNYYAYNAYATEAESVVVAAEGSVINLIFKKSPLVAGVYNWTGAASVYWDDLDDNFNVGGSDDISFQNGNGAAFAGASDNQEISITKDLTLGDGDLTVSGEGYSFTGAGKLSGTGTFKVNTSTSIGIVNNLDGGVEVTAGTLTIKNSDAGKSFAVVPGVTLDLNASLNKPVTGTGGALTILATGAYAHTATITGVDELNYILTQKGNIPLNAAINQTSRFNNVFTGQINVSVSPDLEADTVYFGTTVQHADSKIHLGEKVTLAFTETPANPLSTVSIGELSGEATSGIGGATTAGRGVTYVIGGLNTDAEFAGTINAIPENTGPADGTTHWGRHQLNITKEGTGTWKLTGSSPDFGTRYNDKVGVEADEKTGTFKVVAGTVELYGALGGRLAGIEVDSIGTLKGVGSNAFIGANDVIVNNGGTLAGTLTLANNLSLTDATVKLYVTDTQGAYDKITVPGDLIILPLKSVNTLKITVAKATAGDKIKLIDTPNGLQGEFEQIIINDKDISERPFTWDAETGELTATADFVKIDEVDAIKTVQSVSYYNLTGSKVTKDTLGFIIRKITYTDGSTKTEKTLHYINKLYTK
jgi:hypothetical protein